MDVVPAPLLLVDKKVLKNQNDLHLSFYGIFDVLNCKCQEFPEKGCQFI